MLYAMRTSCGSCRRSSTPPRRDSGAGPPRPLTPPGTSSASDASLAIDGTLSHLDQGKLATIRHRYRSAVLIGSQQTAARAGPLMRKHHALASRLLAREDDYQRYTTDPRVPFDNNAAEREIRMSKLRIKVSGCMRSIDGAGQFCAIRSYLATAAKHGMGKLDALAQAASGNPWIPETA